MKYKKGTFVVVPIEELEKVPATSQAMFIWMCKFADEDGICFPSRKKLATLLNIALRTVDTHLALLVEAGLITKTNRKKVGTKENMSNLYQIQVVQELPDPRAEKDTTPRAENVAVTIPNINSTHLTPTKPPKVAEKPFHFEEEMQKLLESKWKPDRVRWLYFTKKKFRFENHAQMKTALQRNLRPAQALEGYDSDQVEKAIEYCEENYNNIPWTLETILKIIPNIVNKHE